MSLMVEISFEALRDMFEKGKTIPPIRVLDGISKNNTLIDAHVNHASEVLVLVFSDNNDDVTTIRSVVWEDMSDEYCS